VSPFGSTNHLGRQRPPPPPPTRGMSRSPSRRAPSASPYASPYRQRKAAEQAAAAEAEAGAAYSDLFQSLAHTAEILPQSGAKSYDEFRQWLGNNRDWQKKRTNKVGVCSQLLAVLDCILAEFSCTPCSKFVAYLFHRLPGSIEAAGSDERHNTRLQTPNNTKEQEACRSCEQASLPETGRVS